ncbi:MAG: sulfite exporter TauE/SafE family protein [Bacteroidales bacterium]|jgi:uncharacterized membrane protein YfcA|nr:sulfite exporter TauE/SafE family protein [Bacteroidales bacterium]
MIAELNVELFIILIISGIVVGFINTLAGGGTIISMSLFMMLGLPPVMANGTNRIPVILQNLVSVINFYMDKKLDVKKSICCSIPVALGSILGSCLSIVVPDSIFMGFFVIIMVIMLLLMFLKPDKWLKGDITKMNRSVSLLQLFFYFLIGIYAGFIHIGMGYFLLAVLVLMGGFDLLRANAIKSFIVLFYAPFSLIIFISQGEINYEFGFIHAIGNMIGAYIASKWAVNWGMNFIRWVVVIFIVISCLHVLRIIDFQKIFNLFL